MLSKKTECHFKNNKKNNTRDKFYLRISASVKPSTLFLRALGLPRFFGFLSSSLSSVSLSEPDERCFSLEPTSLSLSLAWAWKPKKPHIEQLPFFPQFSVTLMCNSDIIHNIYSVTRLWVHTIKGDAGKIMEMQNIMQRKCRHKANAKSKTRQSKTVIIITLSAAPFKDHHRRSPASISPYP